MCFLDSRKLSAPNFSRLTEDSDIEKLRYGSEGTGKSRGSASALRSPLLPVETNPHSDLSFDGNVQDARNSVPRNSTTNTPGIPVANFSLDAGNIMRPLSLDLSSTGSSVRLNDRQRNKLDAYREKLLEEMNQGESRKFSATRETERKSAEIEFRVPSDPHKSKPRTLSVFS